MKFRIRIEGCAIPVPLRLEVVNAIYVLQAIDDCGGNLTRAARALGIDRRTIYRRLERAGQVLSKFEKERENAWTSDTT